MRQSNESEGERRERIHTTGGIRLVEVPIIIYLGCTVSKLSKKKAQQRTVTSRRAHWGMHVPEGTGLGNLWARVKLSMSNLMHSQKNLTKALTKSAC